MSEGRTAIERLEEMLNEKDRELVGLRNQLEARDYGEQWAWMRQRKSEEVEGLPVPRLEIRWVTNDSWSCVAEYNLVYQHFLGDVLVQPFSVTKQTGARDGRPRIAADGTIDTPFRDGAHIHHDMKQLGLPGFVVFDGHVTKLHLKDRP